ncbi:MAG: hypothetical protein AAB967_02020, partial [Patescibacteria group bacterium]
EINGTSVLYTLDSKKIGKDECYTAGNVAGYTNVIVAERMRRKSTWTRVPEPTFNKQSMYEEFGSGTYKLQDTALR